MAISRRTFRSPGRRAGRSAAMLFVGSRRMVVGDLLLPRNLPHVDGIGLHGKRPARVRPASLKDVTAAYLLLSKEASCGGGDEPFSKRLGQDPVCCAKSQTDGFQSQLQCSKVIELYELLDFSLPSKFIFYRDYRLPLLSATFGKQQFRSAFKLFAVDAVLLSAAGSVATV